MKIFLILFFVFIQVYAQSRTDSEIQVEYLKAQKQHIDDMNALVDSNYTREEMSARVFKLYKDFLLSPLAQEYTVNTLIKQRELNRQLQRGNPLANSSPSFIQISNTPNAQQVSINSQGFPPNQISPSPSRPFFRYPDVKNSLNEPNSALKYIGSPVGGGLNFLFGRR